MNNFVGLWLLSLPLFILIFLEKCFDLHSYRRKLHVKKVSYYLILDMLIIEVSHLLVVGISYQLFAYNLVSSVLPIAVLPLILSLLILFFLYWIERKRIDVVSQQTTLIKRTLEINLKVTCAFSILYLLLTFWNFVYFAESEFIILGEVRKYTLSKGDYMQIIIAVFSILSVVVFKIRSQKNACHQT